MCIRDRYYGTQNLNQGQLDRWNIFTTLNFLKPEVEEEIIKKKIKKISKKKKEQIKLIVKLANLIRDAFRSSDISIIMSPRTSIIWAQNIEIFEDVDTAFKLTFFNRCDESDKKVIGEFYQRCFGRDLV